MAALLAVTLLVTACSPIAPQEKAPPPADAPAQLEEQGATVYQDGALLAILSVAAVQALPTTTVDAGGESNTGPTLRSALKAVGVSTFQRLKVFGTFRGRFAEGEINLPEHEVTDRVILAVNRRGELRLVSPSLPPEQWIVAMKRITVE